MTRRFSAWAVVCVAAVVSACVPSRPPSHPAGSRPSETVRATGVVPWLDAPPRPYQPPLVSTPPPLPTNARRCAPRDVATHIRAGSGASGHSMVFVIFHNVSRSTCVLKGYPLVTATEPGQPPVAATNGSYFRNGHPGNMAPGQVTVLGLVTESTCAKRPDGGPGGPNYHEIAVLLPDNSAAMPIRFSRGLTLACGLQLTRFANPRAREPEPVYPLAALIPTIEPPPGARAGGTLSYIVDLHNPTGHRLVLDPCPGYLESTNTPTVIKEPHELNCAPVGVVASGATVRFAMHMRIPVDTPAGPLVIRWLLNGPGEQARATVEVT